MEVRWALYSRPDTFPLPNYDTGLLDTSWLDFFRNPSPGSGYFGTMVKDGTGKTDRDGLLSIELPELPQSETGQLLTLEVSAMDEAGLPVSARSEMRVHPADFYIGIRPDQWIGRADSPIGFEIYTVDWAQNPSGDKSLNA